MGGEADWQCLWVGVSNGCGKPVDSACGVNKSYLEKVIIII